MWLPSFFQATTFLYRDGGIGRPQVCRAVGKAKDFGVKQMGTESQKGDLGQASLL